MERQIGELILMRADDAVVDPHELVSCGEAD
jgi:hypothetical protein